MKTGRLLVAGIGSGLALTGCGPRDSSRSVAFDLPETATSGKLKVGCTSFQPNDPIPTEYTGYGQSMLPVITWSAPPNGTKSILLLVEDPDAPGSEPFIHWLLRNVSPTARQSPGGGIEGSNSTGVAGYYAPKPPPGAPHHYYFEVFALDRELDQAAQGRDAAIQETKGHVLAKGDFVCTFQKP